LTITNKVSARVTISALPISGSGAGGYRISGITLPKQLAPRASASVTVTFTPANSGSQTASLGITTSSGVVLAQSVPLSGAGVTLMLGLDASLLAYGGVPIGTSAPPIRTATLTNTGTGDLTVSGITVSGGGGAYLAASNPAAPFRLTPNQTAVVTVMFDPVAAGTATGQVSIVSNASNSPSVLSLSGAGLHWVSLTWTASSSPGVIWYNVYWGAAPGGPFTRIGTSAGTSYEDFNSSLISGTTHCYVVTAVDDAQIPVSGSFGSPGSP
jgi:hypothetical protein